MKSPTPPRPDFTTQVSRLFGSLGAQQRRVLLGGLILLFILFASTTLLLVYYIYQPEITTWLQNSSSRQNNTPVSQFTQTAQINLPTHTPTCSGASLQLGATIWKIESIQRNADGSVDIPVDTPGVAYWIKDLELNNVFALSPTQNNLALLKALQGGEESIITWENCNTAIYTLFAPVTGVPGADILSDQASIGIIVYVPASPSGSGWMVEGALAGETILAPPTAESSTAEVNAEVSLLETSTSQDKQTIQVVISIMNYGSAPITLSENNISLTPEGATPLAISRADPKLPQKIQLGEIKTFTLIFPRPDAVTATLKIFTVEYDLEGY